MELKQAMQMVVDHLDKLMEESPSRALAETSINLQEMLDKVDV